jgi:hypothetical protein
MTPSELRDQKLRLLRAQLQREGVSDEEKMSVQDMIRRLESGEQVDTGSFPFANSLKNLDSVSGGTVTEESLFRARQDQIAAEASDRYNNPGRVFSDPRD